MTSKATTQTQKPTTQLGELAVVAAQATSDRRKLLSRSEMAAVPDTPANRMRAVDAIRSLTAQTRAMLAWSIEQRGMYLVWLKSHIAEPREWQAFCGEHFGEISDRTRRYWMASYLQAIGEKQPRALPAYDPDELEDAELAREVEQLSGDKRRTLPRGELMGLVERQQAQITKGAEQADRRESIIQELEEQLIKLTAGDHIPDTVKKESDRVAHIRNRYYGFVRAWIENLPDTPEKLRHHRGLWEELSQHMAEMWDQELYPRFEEGAGT